MQKKRRNITTSEIARLSGVSRSTVSAVLNGKRKVRESTRRKVLETIRKSNYESGMIARTLVGELSCMVAVLAPNLGSPYHMMVFRGISDVLVQHGYHILFHNVRPEDREDPETLESLRAYRPAGYIILRGAEGPDAAHIRAIASEEVPLVTLGQPENVETHGIAFDERLAMRLVTDHVIEAGHRNLGHLAGPSFSIGTRRRQLGFVESLINHDIAVSDAAIVPAGETAVEGYRAALALLSEENPPTALVCFNDMVAMGVYRAANELGLHIPDDVAVTGFDGIDFAELLGPPLTSVDIAPQQSGEMAAELLVKVIRNQVGRGTVIERVEPRLLDRGSVRRVLDPVA